MIRLYILVAVAACSTPSQGGDDDSGNGTLDLIAGTLGGVGNIDATANAARFAAPRFATVGGGAIYITDGNAIRAIDETTGAVTTLAGVVMSIAQQGGHADGTGDAARFASPTGLALDGTTTLYVADGGNRALRAVALADHAVTTLALSGSDDGVGLPIGLVVDGRSLYVADFGYAPSSGPITKPATGGSIRRVELATGAVTTLAGEPTAAPEIVDGVGAAARFGRPRGMVEDGDGTLYVADTCTIRTIAIATGQVTTVAGNATHCHTADGTGAGGTFEQVYGIALDGAGGVIVADGSSTIRRVAIGIWQVTTIAGQAGVVGSADGNVATFGGPTGVAIDAGGDAFVVDSGNFTVRRIARTSQTVSTFAGAAPGAGAADGVGAAARFANPSGVAFDGDDTLYVTDHDNNTIRAVSISTATVTTLAGAPGVDGDVDGVGDAATFHRPAAIAYDGHGALYVAQDLDLQVAPVARVRRIDITTRTVTTIASVDLVVAGLASDGATLYASDSSRSAIHTIDPTTGADAVFAGTPARTCGHADGVGAAAAFCAPGALAYAAGKLYVTDNQTIRAIDTSSATVTTIAGTAGMRGSDDGVGAAALFDQPSGLAADGAGALFVADAFNATIRRIDLASAAVTTYIGSAGELGVTTGPLAKARLNGPWALTAGAPGLVISDVEENAILIAH